MYVLLDYIASKKLDIPFGFIHIPHDCERRKAERFVRRVLRGVAARAHGEDFSLGKSLDSQ
jgi:hypothetical protein